ncbi:ABC-F family ATP-binding cassette domain-containing protein [Desnuesiella massiliensis]|uniref:ABC-F family ATP-binding cassette domain-containing protein n=1 Tax=Desnuesiella massiliensis TaxID=1650662 RepID=UPI0006E2946C|nr:ABC-F family ATP-binding cassette domain-containing protein [Desnuesiella massiliensis]
MNLLTLENITKSYSEKVLLNNISLGINEGEKIGLIGVNGTGKSTFLKIIAGIEVADLGTIVKGNKVRIEYLSQNPDYDPNATVLEQVFKGSSPEMVLLREYEQLLEKINHPKATEDLEKLNRRLIELQGKIDALNAWELESEAKSILTQLGITDFEAKIGLLSGGQKKRVSLASALITPCELLILDEPTNHMDNDTIGWLEKYLNGRKGSLLMITHDRYFLDRVTNRILELHNGNLYSYAGNYSIFLEKKAEREELKLASEKKRENLYRRELAWIKRGAKARTTKQKARIQRFEDIEEQRIDIKEEKLDISVLGRRLGKKIIELKNINKSYDALKLIEDFSYILLREDRIGIVGPNGIGKSTLMNIINGDILPDSGEVNRGETIKIGFFSQENAFMDEAMRVIDYIKEVGEYLPTADGYRITASQMLERFLFNGSIQYAPIGKLSGGEKRRLYLLRALMSEPNILLLDEPTNDLDIQTLTILEDYLDSFEGAIIAVSHDRYFLDRICNKIFSYEGNGKIKQYNGNYEDYIESLKAMEQSASEDSKKNKEKPIKEQAVESKADKKEKPIKFTFKEQKEFEEIDGVIEALENKISEIGIKIEGAASDFLLLQELLKEKEELEKALEEKYDRWTYLNELAEKIEAQKK